MSRPRRVTAKQLHRTRKPHAQIRVPSPTGAAQQSPGVDRVRSSAGYLSLVCLLAHIPLIASHFTMAPVISSAMAAVSIMCVPCIRRLWTSPTTHDCAVAAVLATVMAGSHVILAMSMGAAPPAAVVDTHTAHHHHNQGPTTMSMAHAGMQPIPPALQALFLCATAIAVLQASAAATAIAITVRRHRSATDPAGPRRP